MVQCVAVCCSVLQCVGSVLQCVAVCCNVLPMVCDAGMMLVGELEKKCLRFVVCCSVLQRVAVCCSVLQCVAAYFIRYVVLVSG